MFARLEQVLERLHHYTTFRVFLCIAFAIIVSYINVWLHEFWHFAYVVVFLHDTQAHIAYTPVGIFLGGYCYVTKSDPMLYFIGGYGSAICLLAVWLFLLSIPHHYTTPLEAPVFAFMIAQFVYGTLEGLMIVFTNEFLANAFTAIALITGYILYVPRVESYLRR